jgi:hypothetical protein
VIQVLNLDGIKVDDAKGRIQISFAPTGALRTIPSIEWLHGSGEQFQDAIWPR